jgi:D-alanyl-D-alanine carboxypeptidase
MKKSTAITAALFILLSIFPLGSVQNFLITKAYAAGVESGISTNAGGVVLMEEKTGRVLYGKSERERLYPASTTKMMTALLAIENGNLDDIVTVGDEIRLIPSDASTAKLRVGEQIPLKNLLAALLLPSGNDAAMTIAAYIGRKLGGSSYSAAKDAIGYFCSLMNERAKKIGAMDTHFANPHGYHDNNHYSTAFDLAIIAREAMKNSYFREMVKTPYFKSQDKYVFGSGGQTREIVHDWVNGNALINPAFSGYYPYATGIKTGYTNEAGYCLVSSASKDGLDLITVVLNDTSEDRWKDSVALLDYGFQNYQYYNVVKSGQPLRKVNFNNNSPKSPGSLEALSDSSIVDLFKKSDIGSIKADIKWGNKLFEMESGSAKLLTDIRKDQIIGTVSYTLNDKTIGTVNLKASDDVNRKTFIEAAVGVVELNYIYIVPVIVVLSALCIVYIIIRKRKNN